MKNNNFKVYYDGMTNYINGIRELIERDKTYIEQMIRVELKKNLKKRLDQEIINAEYEIKQNKLYNSNSKGLRQILAATLKLYNKMFNIKHVEGIAYDNSEKVGYSWNEIIRYKVVRSGDKLFLTNDLKGYTDKYINGIINDKFAVFHRDNGINEIVRR